MLRQYYFHCPFPFLLDRRVEPFLPDHGVDFGHLARGTALRLLAIALPCGAGGPVPQPNHLGPGWYDQVEMVLVMPQEAAGKLE